MIKYKNIIFVFLFIFLLLSCSSPNTIISNKIIEKNIIQPNRPTQLSLEEIRIEFQNYDVFIIKLFEMKIINEKQKNELLVKKDEKFAQFVLDKENFRKLSENLLEMERYINQQKNLIEYYENITKN